MKVLIITSRLIKAGPTNQIYNIIKYFNREQIEPVILTISPESKDTMIDKFKGLGVQVHSLNVSGYMELFQNGAKIIERVEAIKPDIIHSSGLRADIIVSKFLNHIPHLTTLRNYPYDDYPSMYGLKGYYIAWKHVNIIKTLKNVTACSKSIAQKFNKKQGLNIDYIQNGVDTEFFNPTSYDEKVALRKNLNIPTNKIVLIYTGNLISRKDTKTTIQAFKASKMYQDSILLIAGDGYERKMLEKLSKQSPNIKFLGKINNIIDYLRASDIFISASLAEGLPNSVIEAMSVGLPCILSDIDPHNEILEYNSNAGYSFKTKNALDLVAKINLCLDSSLSSMSESAKDIINKYLNARIMSENYVSLYKKILTNEI